MLGVVLLVGISAYAVYRIAESPATPSGCAPHPHTLTIWTYDSLFDSGLYPNTTRDEVFSAFENATGSTVIVDYLTGDLAAALEDTRSTCDLPDLVMGLDELEAPRLDAAGMLVPYASPQLAHVPTGIVDDLAPDHSVTPYEYGYLGLDYNLSVDAGCGACLSQGDFFSAMEGSPSLAADLCYPDPLQGDITGEEFLAWEVEYATHVLDQNWTVFWKDTASSIHPQSSWDTGWDEFTAGQCPTFVSYTSDPASETYFGAGGWMNSTVAHHDGENYSWLTAYGTGMVRGPDTNRSLAEDFLNWTLSGTVQDLVPTNEWEYPANDTVPLPSCYNVSEPAASITALNADTTPAQSSAELSGWISELETIVLT